MTYTRTFPTCYVALDQKERKKTKRKIGQLEKIIQNFDLILLFSFTERKQFKHKMLRKIVPM